MNKPTAVAKAEKQVPLKQQLVNARDAIAALVPKHIDPDKVIRLAWLVCYREPKLKSADPVQIVQGVLQASSMGLMIGYDAHLIPYWNKRANRYDVRMQADYRGLLMLARRAGVLDIYAKPVFMGEPFEIIEGDEQKIRHLPRWDAQRDYAHLVGVYAIVVLPNPGGPPIRRSDSMSKSDVEEIRAKSQAKNDGPWVTDPVQMALKTMLRRICKTLPYSPELHAALELDTRAETGHADLVLPDDKEEQLAEDAADKAREKQAALRERLAPPPKGVTPDGEIEQPEPEEPPPQANWPEE